MSEPVLLSGMTDQQVAAALGVDVRICRAVLAECRTRRPNATVTTTVIHEATGIVKIEVKLDRGMYLELFCRSSCFTVSAFMSGHLLCMLVVRSTIRDKKEVARLRRPQRRIARKVRTFRLTRVLSRRTKPMYLRIAARER